MRANTKQRLVAALGFVLCGLSVPVAADGQVDEAKVTVWSGAMVLDKNYEVPEGYTLRIEPGTVIETGKGGWVKLEVKGTLEAVGTKDKPIEFRATRSHSWAGIHFAGPGAGGRVEHCLIRDGRRGAIHCEGASPVIRNVRLVNPPQHEGGILCEKGARPLIEGCEISGARVAVMCDGSAPKVTGNTFEDCPVGVQVWGFKPNDPRPQIGDNKAVRCEILVFDEQTEGTALWPLVYASPLLTRPVTLHVGAQGGRDVVTAYGQGSPSETCWFYSLAFAGNLFTVTAALVPALPGGGSTVVDRITGPDGKECRLITVNPGASILGREGCMDTRTAFVLLVAGAGKDAKILWRSPKIDRGSVTCSFADVDGDGVKEVVVCTGRWCEGKGQILIYHAVPAPSTGPAPSAGSGETTPGPGSSTRPGAAEARPVGAVRSGGAG